MSSPTRGSFVPTTNIWDLSDISNVKNISEDLKELLVRLYQNLNRMSLALNTKDSGYYTTGMSTDSNEFVTGQLFFPNPLNSSATPQGTVFRQTFRRVLNFGPLPNAATISMPHYLTVNTSFTFTRIYGCATNPTAPEYIPLPYSSTTAVADNIELWVDGTNVNIKTGVDYSAYTTTYVILEYLKS